MQKKTYVYYILLMFVLTNVIYGTIIYNFKISSFRNRVSAVAVIKEKESTIDKLVKNLDLTYTNINFRINKEMPLISYDNVQIPLSNIKINDYLLVFRFNEFTCMDCVYKELDNIDSLANVIGSKRILILASYNNNRNLFFNEKVNDLTLPIYNTPLNSLSNSIEESNTPYVFVLDTSYKIHHLFIPNKYFPETSKYYYKGIKELIQNE